MTSTPKKILITGTTGFVGRGLAEYFLEQGWDITGAGRKVGGFPEGKYQAADITQGPEQAVALLSGFDGAVVLHCAGSKDVRWCEANPDAAYLVNASATEWLAAAAGAIEAKFIYLSTDLVFPCDLGGFSENDSLGSPLVYGKTKAAGEDLCRRTNPDSVICRTSGVFSQKSPTMKWLKEELKSGKGVDAYSDVVNTPTYLPDLGVMLETIILRNLSGVFHTCGEESVSRLEWFQEFAKCMDFNERLVRPSEAGGKFKELFLTANSSLLAEASYTRMGLRPRRLTEAFAEMKLKEAK